MAQNVRFIKTTKIKYLNREVYDENALYFCQDTNEIFKGSQVYTDGIRIVQTKAELPECNCAPDGIVYYIRETRNGYTLSPDRTEWLQTIYAPVEDVTTIPESEIYNTVTTVGAVRDIENAIYNYIEGEIEKLNGDSTIDGSIDNKIAEAFDDFVAEITEGDTIDTFKEIVDYINTHGGEVAEITSTINSLEERVGDKPVATQINEAIAEIDSELGATAELVKYEIMAVPAETLVDYREKEIRIYCKEGTVFTQQQVGANGSKNNYYIPFRAYAPEKAKYFKEDMNTTISDNTMHEFENNSFAGIDKYGRKYSLVWLAIAHTNDDGVTWTYYGEKSTVNHYIGFDYSVEWYDENKEIIGKDTIRINLANKNCYNSSTITTDILVNGVDVLVFDCGNATDN